MKTRPGRPGGRTRLARVLGLDRNPLRRATDRAEAWIRAGLLGVFLIAGPIVALDAGHWAYHAGSAAARGPAAPAHRVRPPADRQAPAITGLLRGGPDGRAGARAAGTGSSARTGEVLVVVMTLAAVALALLAVLRLIRALLGRRRLAAWETAWSTVGPQWSRRRP
jgi:hypothetical protein